jgi:hypothetical protein
MMKMTDNVAVLKGYTQEAEIEIGGTTLFLLVKPETDFDSRFCAWDTDMQEFLNINGWLIENLEIKHAA